MSDPRRLRDYVQHLRDCQIAGNAANFKGWCPCHGIADPDCPRRYRCTCGLDALLAEAVAPQPEICPDYICAICYHPKDRCSHCDAPVVDPPLAPKKDEENESNVSRVEKQP